MISKGTVLVNFSVVGIGYGLSALIRTKRVGDKLEKFL